MTKEEFIKTSGNRNTYRIVKKLPDGALSYMSIGDKVMNSTLYDRGYNILKLVQHGYIKNIEEPYEWQKQLVGKNEHSVHVKCPECGSFGINTPLDNQCGNCGYAKGITYYDAETIDRYLTSLNIQL